MIDFGDIDIDALLAEAEVKQPIKRLRDVEQIFLAGNTQVESKADLAKIVEEPCLAVCENLYDKNILTYWSSANKNAPDRAYVLIRYESLDDNNKKIADDLIAQGVLSDAPKYNFDSYNAAQEYGKSLYLGIDTNPDMEVAKISERLCKIAAEFAPQDIKYNVYTPEYLLENSFGKKPETFAFPSLKTAVCGEKLSDDYKPEREAILTSIKIMMMQKQATGLTTDDIREVGDKIGWLYNEENGYLYKDKETLRRHNEYVKQPDNIVNFVDIVNMPYDDTAVDKNIKDLLSGKGYQPEYKYKVKDFLVAEQENLSQSLNYDEFTHHLAFSEDLCNASGFADSKKIDDFIDGFNFTDEKQRESLHQTLTEEVPINFAAGYVFAKPNGEKQDIVSFCGFVENPMYSLYTDIHELAHVMQHQKFYPNIMEKLENATDEHSIQVRDIVMRGYREIHANAFAGAYMMAMAVKSDDPVVIDKVEKMVTQTSTFMSNALINSKLGAAYCDWGATKRVIADIKQNGADKLFNENGRINFAKLYDFSFSKVKEMGYTPQMLLDAYDNEGATVRKIKADTADKSAMIAEVNKIKGDNPILNDFAEAQSLYDPNSGNRLQTLYSRLANPKAREKTLFDKQYDDLPNVSQYRELYTATQKQIQAQLINKARS